MRASRRTRERRDPAYSRCPRRMRSGSGNTPIVCSFIYEVSRTSLANLCYTLQVGREAMEERLALIVSNVDELIDRLSGWSQRQSSADVYRGSLGPRRGSTRPSKVAQEALRERNLRELASMWAAGEDVKWESLYHETRPRRISLPTYPFARERYWITDAPIPEGR